MLSKDEARAIARTYIGDSVRLQKGAPVTVELSGDVYTVTFVHDNPPDTLGPDFDARVRVHAKTGEVLGSEVAP